MIIVTNTIRVEKGSLEHVVRQFTGSDSGHGGAAQHIQNVNGFLGFELWETDLPDADYEELTVMSKWESAAAQQAWVKSDAFKKAHGRTKDSREQKRDRKGILENKITQYQVRHVVPLSDRGIAHE
ncbi:heme oxygenase IsdG [Listeria aquatica]|uniref:heme oxygenase IsdG n=1 Tax=Listeria aquatica TaxID=1494960 RepID=UPI003F7180CF